MPAGRPSEYDPKKTPKQTKKACLMGATDNDLADFFGVSEKTINNWKKEHPEFLQSIKDGKEIADSKVAKSLYERANGYSHPEVHISNYQGKITQTDLTKHYPPETTAAIFWLKNRQPAKWRDRREVTGADGNPIEMTWKVEMVEPDHAEPKD